MNLLILDADGVFMNESPYWKTALAAALVWHDIRVGPAAHWDELSSACFEAERLQRVTKSRRCNSNWDLAAVMIRALDCAETRARFSGALVNHDWTGAVRGLAAAMERMYSGDRNAFPPLAAFGIDRHGEFFRQTVARYQDVFRDRAGLAWPYPRHELAAPAERLAGTFGELRNLGYALGVCTSRDRDETLGPMQEFGILRWFDHNRIATHDDALEAQQRTGVRPLQKPHWFLLARVLLGWDAAVAAIGDGALSRPDSNGRRVFVGDTTSDYECACACRDRGLLLEYVHIDSGLTGDADMDEIRRNPATLGVASDLGGVVALLGEPSR